MLPPWLNLEDPTLATVAIVIVALLLATTPKLLGALLRDRQRETASMQRSIDDLRLEITQLRSRTIEQAVELERMRGELRRMNRDVQRIRDSLVTAGFKDLAESLALRSTG